MVTYPQDWKKMQLKDLGIIKMCRRIFQSQTQESGAIPFYKISTFGGHADAFISRKIFEEYKEKYPYPDKGDVLISAAGTIGKTVVFDGKESYFQDSNIVWLSVDSNLIDNQFLLWFYRHSPWRALEGTTIKRLYNNIILNTKIHLPSLEEQKAIAKNLSAFDIHIDNLTALIEKKKAIRDGALADLMSGRTRLAGFSGKWDDVPIENISMQMVDGPFGSDLKTEHYIDAKEARVIQLSNIGDNGWNDENTKYTSFSHAEKLNRCIAYPGELLIAKMMPAGRAIICPDKEKMYIISSDVVRVILKNGIDSRFIVYSTKGSYYINQIAENTQGSTRQRTSIRKLKKIKLMLPEYEEQKKIADILTSMDEEIQNLEKERDKMMQIREGAMDDLLTGRVRLPM